MSGFHQYLEFLRGPKGTHAIEAKEANAVRLSLSNRNSRYVAVLPKLSFDPLQYPVLAW